MPGKSPKTKYGEFRHFAEWRRGGKVAIKRDLLPPLCAWLLMIGRRYEQNAIGLEHKLMSESLPGLKESAQRLRFASEHIQWLLDLLPVNFAREDWRNAVAEVCQLMDIHLTSEPILDIPDGQFSDLIEVPASATEPSGGASGVQPGVEPREVRPDARRKPSRKRR